MGKGQPDEYPSMLFYLIRENIGLLNYTVKSKEWDKLTEVTKERFTEFANVVRQLKTADELEAETAKKEPPEWNNWRKDIFAKLKERRTYKLTTGQKAGEAKQMSWLFKQGYNPEQIIRAYDTMNSQPFWSDKPLTLMTVAKQIGAMMNTVGMKQEVKPLKQWRTTPETEAEAKLCKELWDIILASVKNQVSIHNYNTWLEGSMGLALDDSTLVVGVKNLTVAEYLTHYQRGMLERILCSAHNTAKELSFVVLRREECQSNMQ